MSCLAWHRTGAQRCANWRSVSCHSLWCNDTQWSSVHVYRTSDSATRSIPSSYLGRNWNLPDTESRWSHYWLFSETVCTFLVRFSREFVECDSSGESSRGWNLIGESGKGRGGSSAPSFNGSEARHGALGPGIIWARQGIYICILNPYYTELILRYLLVIMFSVVESIDEAVQLANTSDYSLVASVWTRDVNTALDVASRIRASKSSYLARHFRDFRLSRMLICLRIAGCTNINGTTIHSEPAAPLFGLG